MVDPFTGRKYAKLTAGRTKKESFIAEMCRRKAFIINGPDKYSNIQNWENNLPKRNGMFFRTQRRTIADDIIHKSKKVETSTPGIGKYNPEAWRAEKKVKVKGFYDLKEERITEFDNYLAIHAPIPQNKYELIALDKIRPRATSTMIEEKLNRWSPGKGSDAHSPSSVQYEIAEAFEKA